MNSFAMRDRPARLADVDADTDAESGEGILPSKNVVTVDSGGGGGNDNERERKVNSCVGINGGVEDGGKRGEIAVTRQWSVMVDNDPEHRT